MLSSTGYAFKKLLMVAFCALLLLELAAAAPQFYGGYGGYGGYGYRRGHVHDVIVDHGDHHHHVPLHCDTFHFHCHVHK
ncbi:hypothetical protein FHG87_000852 [Trinorchestia longiramus]|nr:hypothetical protein FHG87_000852 [Trinorchestia longiramus]